MRSRKGYSLIELLVVLVIMALLIALISAGVLKEIDKARGSTLISEARMTYIAAHTVILETRADSGTIEDYDYMAGLTGAVSDASLPVQTKLSQRMAALLAPDVVLSDKPAVGTARVSFAVKDGVILSMSYETMIKDRLFTITIANGELTVARNN